MTKLKTPARRARPAGSDRRRHLFNTNMWLFVAFVSAAPYRCTWKDEKNMATYDLSHLAKQQDITFGSPMSSLLGAFAGEQMHVHRQARQSISLALCGDASYGRRAPVTRRGRHTRRWGTVGVRVQNGRSRLPR